MTGAKFLKKASKNPNKSEIKALMEICMNFREFLSEKLLNNRFSNACRETNSHPSNSNAKSKLKRNLKPWNRSQFILKGLLPFVSRDWRQMDPQLGEKTARHRSDGTPEDSVTARWQLTIWVALLRMFFWRRSEAASPTGEENDTSHSAQTFLKNTERRIRTTTPNIPQDSSVRLLGEWGDIPSSASCYPEHSRWK